MRYVLAMIEDEGPEDRVREEYARKYERPAQPVKLDTSRAPHAGANDAPIKLVEFYDYECPHCQAFKSQMEQVLSDKPSEVGVSFMMFPIESKHPEARLALRKYILGTLENEATWLKETATAHDVHEGLRRTYGTGLLREIEKLRLKLRNVGIESVVGTLLMTVEALLGPDGPDVLTPVTLWELTAFIDALVCFDRLYCVASPAVDVARFNRRLAAEVLTAIPDPTHGMLRQVLRMQDGRVRGEVLGAGVDAVGGPPQLPCRRRRSVARTPREDGAGSVCGPLPSARRFA